MFSHMTFTALQDLASTDLCHLIFSLVTFTHTVARQRQMSYCPLSTRVFPISIFATAYGSLDLDTLPPSPHVQHDRFFNVWLKCSLLIHETFLDSPSHRKSCFSTNRWCIYLPLYVNTLFSLPSS